MIEKTVLQVELTPEGLKNLIHDSVKAAVKESFNDRTYESSPAQEPLLTLKETAKFLKISLSTARSQIKRGTIPYRKIGARILISRADCLAALPRMLRNKVL